MSINKNKKRKKVLFISHDASQTGAPIIFLNFLKWFKKNTNIPFKILLKETGSLENSFKSLSQVIIFNRRIPILSELIAKFGFLSSLSPLCRYFQFRHLRKQIKNDDYSLIYSNTITNGNILEFLSKMVSCRMLTHVHELDFWINQSGSKNLNLIKSYTSQYIAVSKAVKENLSKNHMIPDDIIEVVHGFIPFSEFKPDSNKQKEIRNTLNISERSIVVGGSGYEKWRKGQDLFIQLAGSVNKKNLNNPIHFVWVGGKTCDQDFYALMHDIKKCSLKHLVHFIPQVSNPLDYYSIFDIFAMVSREDPFPLVNLEVASLGKPIVCFENAGGTSEFLEADAGYAVPYLDIEAMAQKIVLLAENENLRNTFGSAAYQKVKQKYNINVIAPKILDIINKNVL